MFGNVIVFKVMKLIGGVTLFAEIVVLQCLHLTSFSSGSSSLQPKQHSFSVKAAWVYLLALCLWSLSERGLTFVGRAGGT